MKDQKLALAATAIALNDYKALMALVKNGTQSEPLQQLQAKLADVVSVVNEEDTIGIVKLNTTVKLLDHHTNRPMEFSIVLPQDANIKERKVSILTPIGIALIGQSKGEQVMWTIGGGHRVVTILDV